MALKTADSKKNVNYGSSKFPSHLSVGTLLVAEYTGSLCRFYMNVKIKAIKTNDFVDSFKLNPSLGENCPNT
jgi:hypothetical protein